MFLYLFKKLSQPINYHNNIPDILDEAIWGAQFLQKCIDPETPDMVGAVSSGYGYWGRPEKETDNLIRTFWNDRPPEADISGKTYDYSGLPEDNLYYHRHRR